MSTATLYGKLIGHVAADYEKQTSALHNNQLLINRFGEFCKALKLTPDVRTRENGTIALVAHCERGRDHAPIVDMLRQMACKVGEFSMPAIQFRDAYTIWTARVSAPSFKFTLLFYIEEDAS